MANPSDGGHGTITTTVDTSEHSITTITAVGTYRLVLDGSALAAGDVMEIRTKRKLLTGGSQVVEDLYILTGPLSAYDQSVAGALMDNLNTDSASLEWTYKQPFGSARSIPWQVLKWT